MKVKTILPYFGGKTHMMSDIMKIISYAYEKYRFQSIIDVFGGSGKILLNVPNNWKVIRIYNDLDSSWYSFFNVVKDDKKRKRLVEMIELTPTSREIFNQIKDNINEVDDDVLKAFYWAYLLVNSYGGIGSTFISKRINRSVIDAGKNIMLFHEIVRKWEIEKMDAMKLIKSVINKPYVFIYLDPPYLNGGSKYKTNVWGADRLIELSEILKDAKCLYLLNEKAIPKVINILGPPKIKKEYTNHSASNKSTRVEGYWFNFDMGD